MSFTPDVGASVVPRIAFPEGAFRGFETDARARLYADVFHNVQVGLGVLRLEDPGDPGSCRLLAANPAASRALRGCSERLCETATAARYADVIRSGVEQDLGEWRCGGGALPEAVFAVRAFPLPDRCVGVVFEDVTERRRVQEQLQQGQRMETLGRLATGLAHDFNNIVTAVMGYSELLVEHDLPAPLRDHVLEIFDAAGKAAALNRQLMAFGRRQALAPRVVDLRHVVAGVQKMLRRLIGEDVEVITDLPERLGRVRADSGQIEQVLLNLSVNARDAMPHGGTLTLRLADAERSEADVRDHDGAAPGPHVMLEVADTGVGIDRDTLAHVFEPFFTTKAPGRGTGLGLATVHGIVRQGGGHVEVESTPGFGTTFRIFLPRVEDEERDEAGADAATFAATGSETLLVVEDHAPVRDLLRHGLEAAGYRVLQAEGAADALRVAAEHSGPIQLLVTDVVMPRMTGAELWVTLGARRPGLKVLFVSGYPDDATLDLLGDGALVLQKPFTRVALARKVREALDATGA